MAVFEVVSFACGSSITVIVSKFFPKKEKEIFEYFFRRSFHFGKLNIKNFFSENFLRKSFFLRIFPCWVFRNLFLFRESFFFSSENYIFFQFFFFLKKKKKENFSEETFFFLLIFFFLLLFVAQLLWAKCFWWMSDPQRRKLLPFPFRVNFFFFFFFIVN